MFQVEHVSVTYSSKHEGTLNVFHLEHVSVTSGQGLAARATADWLFESASQGEAVLACRELLKEASSDETGAIRQRNSPGTH